MITRALVAAGVFLALACSRPLPEADTAVATLYLERCGSCHVAYRPALLTAKMWEAMVDRMEIEIERRGRSLDPKEKAEIVAYLRRNAGTR